MRLLLLHLDLDRLMRNKENSVYKMLITLVISNLSKRLWKYCKKPLFLRDCC